MDPSLLTELIIQGRRLSRCSAAFRITSGFAESMLRGLSVASTATSISQHRSSLSLPASPVPAPVPALRSMKSAPASSCAWIATSMAAPSRDRIAFAIRFRVALMFSPMMIIALGGIGI